MIQFDPASVLYFQPPVASATSVTFTVASFVIPSELEVPVSAASAKVGGAIGIIV